MWIRTIVYPRDDFHRFPGESHTKSLYPLLLRNRPAKHPFLQPQRTSSCSSRHSEYAATLLIWAIIFRRTDIKYSATFPTVEVLLKPLTTNVCCKPVWYMVPMFLNSGDGESIVNGTTSWFNDLWLKFGFVVSFFPGRVKFTVWPWIKHFAYPAIKQASQNCYWTFLDLSRHRYWFWALAYETKAAINAVERIFPCMLRRVHQ